MENEQYVNPFAPEVDLNLGEVQTLGTIETTKPDEPVVVEIPTDEIKPFDLGVLASNEEQGGTPVLEVDSNLEQVNTGVSSDFTPDYSHLSDFVEPTINEPTLDTTEPTETMFVVPEVTPVINQVIDVEPVMEIVPNMEEAPTPESIMESDPVVEEPSSVVNSSIPEVHFETSPEASNVTLEDSRGISSEYDPEAMDREIQTLDETNRNLSETIQKTSDNLQRVFEENKAIMEQVQQTTLAIKETGIKLRIRGIEEATKKRESLETQLAELDQKFEGASKQTAELKAMLDRNNATLEQLTMSLEKLEARTAQEVGQSILLRPAA